MTFPCFYTRRHNFFSILDSALNTGKMRKRKFADTNKPNEAMKEGKQALKKDTADTFSNTCYFVMPISKQNEPIQALTKGKHVLKKDTQIL